MTKKSVNMAGMLNSAHQNKKLSIVTKCLERFMGDMLDLPREQPISHDTLFSDLGMDSIMAVMLKEMINTSLDGAVEIESTDIFDNPTINQLANYLGGLLGFEGLDSDATLGQPAITEAEVHAELEKKVAELSKDEVMDKLKKRLEDE